MVLEKHRQPRSVSTFWISVFLRFCSKHYIVNIFKFLSMQAKKQTLRLVLCCYTEYSTSLLNVKTGKTFRQNADMILYWPAIFSIELSKFEDVLSSKKPNLIRWPFPRKAGATRTKVVWLVLTAYSPRSEAHFRLFDILLRPPQIFLEFLQWDQLHFCWKS